MTNKAKIFCDECDKWYLVEYNLTSELLESKCPKCGSNKIWFGEIECNRSDTIIMGRGGRKQK